MLRAASGHVAPVAPRDPVRALREQLAYEQKLVHLVNRIHAAKSLDSIFIDMQDEILELLDAERMTLYAIDQEKKELYSKFLALDTVREIRIPISARSIAGYVALTAELVNIADAYDNAELVRISQTLAFDASWDKKTGFRTAQVLAAPILSESKAVLGVIQLLNKKHGVRFTTGDQAGVLRIAKTLGIAFHTQHQLAQKRPAKFDYLLTHHRITQEELDAAIGEARSRQADVESILTEQYKVPKAEVGLALSNFYRCPFIEFDERIAVPRDLIKDVKLEYLKKNFWVPLRREGDAVLVLVDNPQDLRKIDDIQQLLRNQKVRYAVGLRQDISRFISGLNGDSAPKDSITSILGELRAEPGLDTDEEAVGGEMDEHDSSIVRLANQIIMDAYKARASDIHIEPYGARGDTGIRYRVDGTCMEYQRVPAVYRRALVARLKIMAQLDIAERRKPQDGKIKFRTPEREIDLRVVTVPTAGGNEDMVLRILTGSEPIPLDKLELTERNLGELKKIAEKPYGLILVVGPTGSGKTTTLHAVLGHINKPERKIWTVEDPVEITQYGLRQVQVQLRIGLTFAAAMRSFLRADPDVIMVGEMRDGETAAIGIEASLTGHLVFSTLHTNSAVETVVRLLDMGMDPFNFADALLGVLAQRLVKRICNECREPYHPSRAEYDELAMAFGEERLAQLGATYEGDFVLYRGKGCSTCNNTGYRGRAGIHELLMASDEIKRLIQTKARVAELFTRAKEEGMLTLVQDGIVKCLRGLTDFKQVKAVAIK
jgi:type II secretory ATPase GspE/PulE/Tfp pilus assembly ATPase PilB-like protein/GAF domain-containing protein